MPHEFLLVSRKDAKHLHEQENEFFLRILTHRSLIPSWIETFASESKHSICYIFCCTEIILCYYFFQGRLSNRRIRVIADVEINFYIVISLQLHLIIIFVFIVIHIFILSVLKLPTWRVGNTGWKVEISFCYIQKKIIIQILHSGSHGKHITLRIKTLNIQGERSENIIRFDPFITKIAKIHNSFWRNVFFRQRTFQHYLYILDVS